MQSLLTARRIIPQIYQFSSNGVKRSNRAFFLQSLFAAFLHCCKLKVKSLYFQVSLQNQQGVIQYDSSVTSPTTLVDTIEDMGFDASVSEQGVQKRTQTGKIAVEGMTCNSCVRSIEQQIGSYTGVHSIKVGFQLCWDSALVVSEKKKTPQASLAMFFFMASLCFMYLYKFLKSYIKGLRCSNHINALSCSV